MFHLHFFFIWIWILTSINAHMVCGVCRRSKTPRGCVTPVRAGPVIRLWRPGFSGPGRVYGMTVLFSYVAVVTTCAGSQTNLEHTGRFNRLRSFSSRTATLVTVKISSAIRDLMLILQNKIC